MFSKTVALLAAASTVSAVCSYPPPIANQSPGNSVTRPDSYTPATIGTPFQIVWDATGWESTVDIHLLKGPGNNIQLYSTLATGVPNTGSFTWTPDCSLEAATTGWGLMIVSEPSCSFQWSMQFGLNPAASGTCASSSAPAQISTSSTVVPASSSVINMPSGSSHPSGHPSGKPSGYPSGGDGPRPTGGNGPYPSGTPGNSNPGNGNPGNGGYPGNPGTPASVCPYTGKTNCTSTSTVWVKPTGTVVTNSTTGYKPIYANGASTYGMGMFTAVVAVAAAFLAC